jgi:hypothetical protein
MKNMLLHKRNFSVNMTQDQYLSIKSWLDGYIAPQAQRFGIIAQAHMKTQKIEFVAVSHFHFQFILFVFKVLGLAKGYHRVTMQLPVAGAPVITEKE